MNRKNDIKVDLLQGDVASEINPKIYDILLCFPRSNSH